MWSVTSPGCTSPSTHPAPTCLWVLSLLRLGLACSPSSLTTCHCWVEVCHLVICVLLSHLSCPSFPVSSQTYQVSPITPFYPRFCFLGVCVVFLLFGILRCAPNTAVCLNQHHRVHGRQAAELLPTAPTGSQAEQRSRLECFPWNPAEVAGLLGELSAL